jgi:hypothetical protein
MANGPTTPAKDVVGTTAALDNFVRQILAVPHSAIKAKLDQEKAAKRTRSRRSASRASVSSSKRAN